ncbi:MAG: MerR family transcriptional regulator [Clostridiales bacterium]|jgi:DNA-binding transcriptional MerR regulator|nr:MerR family transcriptional regulator [Clostridiales bacterium]
MSINKSYSVGEVAKQTGLTVRTLQHYDNVGLLPPSGRTEGGRRFYTDRDMLTLSQIVFYKSVGIQLSDIRYKLSDAPSLVETEAVFTEQMKVLLRKIDELHGAVTVLTSALDTVKKGKEPQFETLAVLIRALEGGSLADWVDFKFDPALEGALENSEIYTLTGAMDFYHTMRKIFADAIALQQSGAAASDAEVQNLGKRWWEEIILKVTAGNDEGAIAALTVNNDRSNWPEADRKLFEQAEPFIEIALGAYIAANNIEVPAAMMGGETR